MKQATVKPIERTNKQGFEIQTCSRCGGSGQYSYCQMYGTRCFGCGGSGTKLTKRGAAAVEYLRALRTAKVADVQVGWFTYCEGTIPGVMTLFKSGWYEVTEVKPSGCKQTSTDPVTGATIEHNYIDVRAAKVDLIQSVGENGTIKAVPNREAMQATFAQALEYQARLNLNGKEARR